VNKIGKFVGVVGLVAGAAAGGLITPDVVNLQAQSSAAPASQVRWEEDSLPPTLYLWTDVHGGDLVGPRRADRWANEAQRHDRQHRGCWASVADTTLVMCPDGFYTTS